MNLIIDDTPEAVVLSCFDPVRRETARMTLEKLVADGRIHPARIEEIHERSGREIDEQIRRAGEDAVAEVGITDIHPEMIKLLGRLQYRTSYGQNVLKHLVESAHIASAIAGEIGVDPAITKRGAFLHDIGKAVTHEVEGSHAIIGAEIARRLRRTPRSCTASSPTTARSSSTPSTPSWRRSPTGSAAAGPARAESARDLRQAARAPGGDLHRLPRRGARPSRPPTIWPAGSRPRSSPTACSGRPSMSSTTRSRPRCVKGLDGMKAALA